MADYITLDIPTQDVLSHIDLKHSHFPARGSLRFSRFTASRLCLSTPLLGCRDSIRIYLSMIVKRFWLSSNMMLDELNVNIRFVMSWPNIV